ncbi:MAG TPA: allantoate amidohydrolase [Streptosporangiaceae bacterium]|nr:allantoate amidohydrolase [Streptosporangiaceae bacterium]
MTEAEAESSGKPAPGEQAPGEQAAWEQSFAELWESLLPVGRTPAGYRRYSWTPADEGCRAWFRAAAQARGLPVESDRNGNLWAWWHPAPAAPATSAVTPTTSALSASGALERRAVAVGSHLDSVPDGGAFDGPLGVASAFAAIDLLRERGFAPARPIAVAAFTEEEGARFGVACLGSRLLAGAIEPAAAAGLRDGDGVSLAEAMAGAGLDPAALGPDDDRLAGLAAYVELHIEQGSALDGLGAPVGLAAGIWPHGRWRLEFAGRADHAGTTRIADRHDPMLPFGAAVLAARAAAVGRGALATFGKVIAEPGAANGISSAVRAWLDARAPDEPTLEALITEVTAAARAAAAEHGVALDLRRESFTPAVSFDPALRDRLATALDPAPARPAPAGPASRGPGPGRPAASGGIPVLPTGAGHDAGILAARLPTAMLFVRNPTGVSHSPAEHADLADCLAGVAALAAVLADLAGR